MNHDLAADPSREDKIIARNAIKLLRSMMDQIASIDYNCRQKARLGSAQPIANAIAADAVPKLLMNLTA